MADQIAEQFDKDFPPIHYPPTYEAPLHNEAPCVMFCTYYTPDAQAKNVTIRANSLEDLFRQNTDLENFVVEQGWAVTPPGFTANKPSAQPGEPVYEDIPQSGPIKLEVQSVELDFTKTGKPYLRVKVNHPAIQKPVMAWFEIFKNLGVSTSIPQKTTVTKEHLPPAIKHIYVEQGVSKDGKPEWQAKSFAA